MSKFLNPPFEFRNIQTKYISALSKSRYIICAAEQGQGKTLIGMRAALEGKTIIVVPAFLRLTWLMGFKEFIRPGYLPKICLFDGGNLKEVKENNWDVLIVSYSMLDRIEKLDFGTIKTIVYDEFQDVLNPKSKRSKATLKICNKYRPDLMLWMSGTPNKGKGKQWYMPLLVMSMNPKATNGDKLPDNLHSYWDFQNQFCQRKVINVSGREVTIFEGIKNEKELAKYLKGKYFQFPSEDLGVTLSFKDVWVDENKSVEEIDKELFMYFESNGVDTPHMMSLKAKSAQFKASFTAEYSAHVLSTSGNPVIIFTDHRASQDAIVEKLKGEGRIGVVNGSTSMKARNKIVEDFQNGKIDYYVATITSSNTGITLHRSNNIIMNDDNWDFVQNEQAYYRIFRIGQKNNCMVHQVLSSSYDQKIRKNINKNKQGLQLVLKNV